MQKFMYKTYLMYGFVLFLKISKKYLNENQSKNFALITYIKISENFSY